MAGECPRIGNIVGGCKFVPRYDTKPASAEQIAALQGLGDMFPDDLIDLIHGLTDKTYVLDICIRCGKVVKRT
jgi:hypothetical protein